MNSKSFVGVLGLVMAICTLGFLALIVFRSVPLAATPEITSAKIEPLKEEPSIREEVPPPIEVPKDTRTVRDVLREYYGDEWASKEAELEKKMKDQLDRLITEKDALVPWEEAEEQVKKETLSTPEKVKSYVDAVLEWDPNTDLSWEAIRENFHETPKGDLGIASLREFQMKAKDLNTPIRELATSQQMIIADTMSLKWERGEFTRSPYLSLNEPDSNRGPAPVSACTASKTGWCVSMYVYPDELPSDWMKNQQMIQMLVAKRNAELTKYLKSLKQ